MEICADEEATLTAHALSGARIALLLEADGWPEDVPTPPSADHEGYMDYLRTYGVRPIFVFDDGPSDFTVNPPRLSSRALNRLPAVQGARRLVARWLPGELGRHWLIEAPGKYRIRVQGPGWQDVETEVLLSAGEDALVRLIISAKP